ncbi:unnamed protein product, partial [Leptidea sinapis]
CKSYINNTSILNFTYTRHDNINACDRHALFEQYWMNKIHDFHIFN